MNRKISFLAAGLIIALVAGIAIAAAVYTITSNTLTFPVKPASTPSSSSSPNPQVTLKLEGREYYPPPVQYVFERDGVLETEPLLLTAILSDKMEGVTVTFTLTKVGDASSTLTKTAVTEKNGIATLVVPEKTLAVGSWSAVAKAEHP